MLFDVLMKDIWDIVKNSQYVNEITNNKKITIDYNNNLWKMDDNISGDPILLINQIDNIPSPILSFKRFYEKENPDLIITDKMLNFYNNIVGNSAFIMSNLKHSLDMDDDYSFIIPDYDFIRSNMGIALDKMNKMFPDYNIYSGKRSWLLIDACNVINGIVIEDSEYYLIRINSFIKNPVPLFYNKFLNSIFDGNLSVSLDKIQENSVSYFSYISASTWYLPKINKINILENNLSKINYIFDNDNIYNIQFNSINNNQLYKFLSKKVNKKTNIDKIFSIVKNVSEYEFELFRREIVDTENYDDSFLLNIDRIRMFKPDNIMSKFNIDLLAKKSDSFFVSDDVIIKINNLYDIISVSESSRNSFTKRADVNKKYNDLMLYNNEEYENKDKILNKLFDEIKYHSFNLPNIKEIKYDGIWELDDKSFSLVTKNMVINNEELINFGSFPIGKYVEFNNSISSKQYLFKKISSEHVFYSDTLYYPIIKMLFEGNMKNVIYVSSKREAELLIRLLTNSTNFIKYIKPTSFNKYYYNLYNSKLILTTYTDDEFFMDNIDDMCYLGIKKENGFEFEPKIYSSILLFHIIDDNEFKLYKNGTDKLFIDDLVYFILNSKNNRKEYDKILTMLDKINFEG